MTKIIKIGQCFTELLKNNTGTVFLRHGVEGNERRMCEYTITIIPLSD